jgi:hypothetical protein
MGDQNRIAIPGWAAGVANEFLLAARQQQKHTQHGADLKEQGGIYEWSLHLTHLHRNLAGAIYFPPCGAPSEPRK